MMTIEQKAEAYDKAIKVAKDIRNGKATYISNETPVIEAIFPELKENSDEEIRKELAEFLKSASEGCLDISTPYKKFGRWLDWLSSQDEQKSDDRVEKFKVGEWVVNKFGGVWHIDSFDKKNYQVSDGGGNNNYFSIDYQDEMHHWTIADAKNGDVLVASDGSIFLFAGVVDCACKYYAALATDNYVKINKEAKDGYWETSRAVIPATKEQRDKFEKAMSDAGYEFDFDKKESKKIEKPKEKSVITSLKDFQEAFELKARQYDIELPNRGYDIHAMCKELYSLLIEQNPTWSEEDEKMIWAIPLIIKSYPNQEMFYGYSKEKLISWIESFKERVLPQSQQDWSEEDDRIYRGLHNLIYSTPYCDSRKELSDWLKSLKERHTWKPSDEQVDALNWALSLAKNCCEDCAFDLRTLQEQLKKLKE